MFKRVCVIALLLVLCLNTGANAMDYFEAETIFDQDEYEMIKDTAVFPGLTETASFRYTDGYKCYSLDDSRVLLQTDGPSIKSALGRYSWLLITSQSNEVKIVNKNGTWTAAGYSYGLSQMTKTGILQKGIIVNLLENEGVVGNVSELYFFEAPMYFLNALLVIVEDEEYVIPFSIRSDFTGLEDGKLYKRSDLSAILSAHFPLQEETDEIMYGGSVDYLPIETTQIQQGLKFSDSDTRTISISLTFVAALLSLAVVVLKKRDRENNNLSD